MSPRPVLLARTAARLATLGFGVITAFVLACGGGGDGDGDGGTLSEDDATQATNRFLMTSLGLFTGDTSGQEFLELFAPECREGIDASELDFVFALLSGFAPDLKDVEIEAVDTGPLIVEETAEGIRVSPEDPDNFRVKVDGKFIPADQLFADAGFEADDTDIVEPILLVRRDGRLYIGECDQLSDFSGGGLTP